MLNWHSLHFLVCWSKSVFKTLNQLEFIWWFFCRKGFRGIWNISRVNFGAVEWVRWSTLRPSLLLFVNLDCINTCIQGNPHWNSASLPSWSYNSSNYSKPPYLIRYKTKIYMVLKVNIHYGYSWLAGEGRRQGYCSGFINFNQWHSRSFLRSFPSQVSERETSTSGACDGLDREWQASFYGTFLRLEPNLRWDTLGCRVAVGLRRGNECRTRWRTFPPHSYILWPCPTWLPGVCSA